MNTKTLVTLIFGTRPEIIKLAPVYHSLSSSLSLRPECLYSGQQRDLGPQFIERFNLRLDTRLEIMESGETLASILGNAVSGIAFAIAKNPPSLVVVQGDTTTALAGALAANMLKIPIAHVEAGLRTGDMLSPFPEESNRKVISHLSQLHLAATPRNVKNLAFEGIHEHVVLTGNPIVDALQTCLATLEPSDNVKALLAQNRKFKIIVVTMHRRENFGVRMAKYFQTLRAFVTDHPEYLIVCPRHPNPTVGEAIDQHFADHANICVISPLDYDDFIYLLSHAWLIASDSGGIQEEAVTLGKPLLILREKTERPEAIDCGAAELVPDAKSLITHLKAIDKAGRWHEKIKHISNPFGHGSAGGKIRDALELFLSSPERR